MAIAGFRPRMLEAWDSLVAGGLFCSMMDFISSASRVSYFNNASVKIGHVNVNEKV